MTPPSPAAAYLVRHAKAGDRRTWDGPDAARPLSRRGQRQAEALADALGTFPIRRILSSPAVRCAATVEPLAARLGLAVEPDPRLAEATGRAGALAVLDENRDGGVVLCSHADVLGALLSRLVSHLAGRGVALDDTRLAKASTWVLELADGAVRAARYLPAPR